MRARERDAGRLLAEPTPAPPVSASVVAAKRPLRVCKAPLRADSAPLATPGNDALPLDPRGARSGSKRGDALADLPVERIIPHLDAVAGHAPAVAGLLRHEQGARGRAGAQVWAGWQAGCRHS